MHEIIFKPKARERHEIMHEIIFKPKARERHEIMHEIIFKPKARERHQIMYGINRKQIPERGSFYTFSHLKRPYYDNIYKIYIYTMDLKKDFKIKNTIRQKCPKKIINKTYKNYKKFTKKKNLLNAIEYIAKLNIPLLPKNKSNKQVVLGTTKYLLPYFCLTDYFEVFALNPNDWTIDKNNILINTIVKLNENIIRLITTPENLMDSDNSLRITGKELCILLNNNYEIYKLINNEYTIEDVYFLIKKDNTIKIENNDLILINKEYVVFYI